MVSFYMDGAAQKWYYRFEQNCGHMPSMDQFVEEVNKRFGLPV